MPGYVGVRQVKWLSGLCVSREEADGVWQRGMAYKGFGPSVTSLKGIDLDTVVTMQEMPVTSMVSY